MRFLEYLFFKYFNWQIKVGNGEMPSFFAVFFIAFVFTLYLIDIILLYYFFVAPAREFIRNKFVFVIIFFSLFIVFYYLLAAKGKDFWIMETHKEEWTKKKNMGAILFPIIAFVLFNIEVYLKIQVNNGVW